MAIDVIFIEWPLPEHVLPASYCGDADVVVEEMGDDELLQAVSAVESNTDGTELQDDELLLAVLEAEQTTVTA